MELAPLRCSGLGPLVNVQIPIHRDGAWYSGSLQAVGQAQLLCINMSPEDLKVLNKDFQDAMEQVAHVHIATGTPKPVKQEKALRLSCAAMGHNLTR